jgi:hypothetical protein
VILRRRRAVAVVAAVVGVGAAGLAIGLAGSGSSSCGSAVGVSQVPPVFAPVSAPVVRTDPQLDQLVHAVGGSGLGRVIGAVGYDQTEWLRSAAVPGGFATWTVDNAVIGFRDEFGRVRWGLQQGVDPQAWAVVGSRFVNLDLRAGRPVHVAAYDPVTGESRWCADLGSPTVYGDPLTVVAGSSDSVWAVTAGPTLSHVDAHGVVESSWAPAGVDRAAFVTQIGSVLVVGGRASHLLTAPDPKVPGSSADGPVVSAFDATSRRVLWRWGRGEAAHVVGQAGDHLIVEVASKGGLELVALGVDGRQGWTVGLPMGTTADMTLRGGRTIIVRSAQTLSGYDAMTGARRWSRGLRDTTFPDGFDLSTQPTLGGRVLLGTTTALLAIDPRTGDIGRFALPLDRASTTFWPYEIVVSGHSAIVETNAGAVLVALRPQL